MVFKAVSEKIDFDAVKESTTLTGEALAKKQARDKELEAIIKGEDNRTLLVIGPCSSDNEDAVLDYAHRLAKLQEEVKDKVFMVMRVYTAKPRTNGDGYKGLVHQPDAEGKPNLINGIKAVRNLHYRVITETGITTADEMLYPENLPLVDDLVSYIAIGARADQDGISRRHSGQKLAQREHGEHAQQHPLELEARGKHHERQRQQHDAPGVDRDHDARLGLGERERRGDISQKADGHKLRRVEHERAAGEPDKREPLLERDAILSCLGHVGNLSDCLGRWAIIAMRSL